MVILLLLLLFIVWKQSFRSTIFGPRDLFVEYKGFSLISLCDKPLLGNGYARVFLLHIGGIAEEGLICIFNPKGIFDL